MEVEVCAVYEKNSLEGNADILLVYILKSLLFIELEIMMKCSTQGSSYIEQCQGSTF